MYRAPLMFAIFTMCLLVAFSGSVAAMGTLAGTLIQTTSTLNYTSTTTQSAAASVNVTVAQVAGVTLMAGSAPASTAAGQTYYVPLTMTNTGNGIDSIALSAASSNAWPVAFIRDDNGDGVHQSTEVTVVSGTGGLSADGVYKCFLRITVPTTATTSDTETITATSGFSATTIVKAVMSTPAPASHSISFTQAPAANPTAVASKGNTQCSATAVDSSGHTVSYGWADGGAGGSFSPSALVQNPVYTAPSNVSGSDKVITLTCNAWCSQNTQIAKLGSASLTVRSDAVTMAAQFDPNTASASLNTAFATPHIIMAGPTYSSTGTIYIDIPAGFNVDTTSTNGSLNCVAKGSGVSTLYSTWDAQSRTITVTATMTAPGPNVEIVKSITLTPTSSSQMQINLNDSPALTVSVAAAASVPGDLNRDGVVNLSDMSLFTQEWARWHKYGTPAFSASTDGVFDLAPRTTGSWPNWTAIGDKTINIQDATVFAECMVGSKSASPSYSSNIVTYTGYSGIYVYVNSAPYGLYQANVAIPSWAKFYPYMDNNGNLTYVLKQPGNGNIFYSEYDPVSRTVRITGNVSGYAPYSVAMIYIFR